MSVESPTLSTCVTDMRSASPAESARNVSVHTSVGSVDGAYVVSNVDAETSASYPVEKLVPLNESGGSLSCTAEY
eukprot:7334363-Prymnesium_polylepis.1